MAKKEKRNFRLKIHTACSNDDLRPVMSHVYFDNGFMVATDAHILVKAAVQKFSDFDRSEVDILNGKFLHKSTFKKILACDTVIVTEEGIKDLATNDVYKFNDPGSKFPNYEAIIPKGSAAIEQIGITPGVVKKLMTILTSPDIISMKMVFQAANRAITIKGIGDNEGEVTAILMPVMLGI